MPPASSQLITRPIGELFGQHPGYGFAGIGVATAIGNFTQTGTDLGFPGGLLGLLDWARSYNSLSTAAGLLGPGWATSLTPGLQLSGEPELAGQPAGTVLFHDVDGRVLPFLPDGTGGFTSPQDLAASLTRNPDGSYTLGYSSGESWTFDAAGRLTDKSLEGQRLTLGYDGQGRLLRADHSAGPHLTFSYDDAGRLTQVAASSGRTVSYGYDDAGNLASVTGPAGGSTSYTSDGGRITQITDPDGSRLVANSYDPAIGRVSAQDIPLGGRAEFGYDTGTGRTTVSTGAAGTVLAFQANADGRMTSVTDAAGNAATFGYDEHGYLATAAAPGGSTLSQTHDTRGNLLTSTFGGATTSYEYDSADRLTSITDPAGLVASYGYPDSSHIPSRIVAPGGAVTSLTVTAGRVSSSTDPDGRRTSYGYDPAGNLTSITDPAGRATQFGYDQAGNCIQVTAPSGAASQFGFDAGGQVTTATHPDGSVTAYRYSAAGRLLEVTDGTGASTVTGYDAAGLVASVTDPLGRAVAFQHDAAGRLQSVTNPAGAVTTLAYNGLGQLISITDPLGDVVRYSYDTAGNQVSETDPLGNVTHRTFDARGNLTSVTDPVGGTARYAYDLNDRLIQVTDPAGSVWQTAYDATDPAITGTDPAGGTTRRHWTPGGKLTATTDPAGHQTQYTRDATGRITEITDPDGGVTRHVYDADGRLISVTTPAGLTSSYRYDAAGKLIATVDPRGWITRNEFNQRGQRTAVIRPSGAVTRYRYDPAGQLTEVTDPNGSVTEYGYDQAGRLAMVTGPDGSVTRYGYDQAGRLTSITDPLGRVTRRDYDKAGNLITITDPDGHSQHLSYDAAGRLTGRTADGATPVSYGYDKAGRRISMTDATGTTRYSYDSSGRLVAVTDPDGATTTAGYDAAGQRTSLSYPGGLDVSYGYDGNGRLISLTDSRSGAAAYSLDPDGRLLTEELPGRLARRYHYDQGLLTSFAVIRDDDLVARTAFRWDPDGRLSSQRDRDTVTRYGYDPAGQLTSVAREPARPQPRDRAAADGRPGQLQLRYDSLGNRVSLHDGRTETRYRYDPASQLLGAETGGRPTEYHYDGSGRLTEVRDGDRRRVIRYDGFGHPAEMIATEPGRQQRAETVFTGDGLLAAATFTDADDRRDEQRQARVSYRWGAVDRIPQILAQRAEPRLDDAEHDHPGPLSADFCYGYGRTFASAGHQAATFERDAIGSAIRTDATEPWVRDRGYDAFGGPDGRLDGRAQDGRPERADLLPELPRFGYRGELELGPLIYLRARTYDAALGRFTTPDPATVVATPGQPVNPYAYASNDPLDRTDPLGERVVPPPGGSIGDAASASRDLTAAAAAATAAAITGAVGAIVTDVARIAAGVRHAPTVPGAAHDTSPARRAIPPGWPGFLNWNWFSAVGSPPTCPESESCAGVPSPAFRSMPVTAHERWVKQELGLFAVAAIFAHEDYASIFLQHFLSATGTPLYLTGSAMQSFYQVPSVKQVVDNAALNKIPAAVRSKIARGQAVPPWDYGTQSGSSILAWSRGLVGPAGGNAVESLWPFASGGGQQDWHLAVKDFDYRIWNWSVTGTNMTFQFEMSKYYNFGGAPFSALGITISGKDLVDLQGEGLAQNFWIVGVSNEITIPISG